MNTNLLVACWLYNDLDNWAGGGGVEGRRVGGGRKEGKEGGGRGWLEIGGAILISPPRTVIHLTDT